MHGADDQYIEPFLKRYRAPAWSSKMALLLNAASSITIPVDRMGMHTASQAGVVDGIDGRQAAKQSVSQAATR